MMGNTKATSVENNNARIFKSGYLMKQSKHIKQYKSRWMVLTDTLLFISYKTRRCNESTEVFDLQEYTKIKTIPLTKEFQLISSNSERTFKASSECNY